jgi:hypothetical protein
MLKETSSSYFILGNLTLTKDEISNLPNQSFNEIEVEFPILFKKHLGIRYVKFNGCSLQYMRYDGPEEDFEELVYNPLHTTLHSNIVNNDNTESAVDKSKLIVDPTKPIPSHINEFSDYVLTVNNYFNQKLYKIPVDMNKLKFYFIDENGEKVNVLRVYHYLHEETNPEDPSQTIQVPYLFYFQALYNIEMELITGYK